MKKISILLACISMSTSFSIAQALPKWASKAQKAVFSIVTYDKNNSILNTGNGFFIDEKGTALSDYTLFKGANRAVVITADGKEQPVKYILGANGIYDVVKFSVETSKKTAALPVATTAISTGQNAYLLPYATQKSNSAKQGTVNKVDTIANNAYYYTLSFGTEDKEISCPVMNEAGEVVAMIQKNSDAESKVSYAIGASFAADLSISALSLNDAALQGIGIKKALPDTEDQALIYLFMASSQLEPAKYSELLDDFIAQYPNNTEGYLRRATYAVGLDQEQSYAAAEADLEQMLKVSANKEESYYQISKLIYNYTLAMGEKPLYKDWGYEKALTDINEALKIKQEGIYLQLQGDIYFAMKKYADAYTSYNAVNQTPIASAATYFSAAKALELSESSDTTRILSLLDSAVNKFNEPYGQEAAPYLYERAAFKSRAGKHREAVLDYNLFYDAMLGQVNVNFYLEREQSAIQSRMYQQAIDDINKATELAPQDANIWLEKGSVHVRVGQHDEAVAALDKCIELDAKNAAAYRMKGYSLVQLKKKKEAREAFLKAKELGDTVAEGLMNKYCK